MKMHFFLLFLLVLSTVFCLPQEALSQGDYQKGIALHKAGKYREAVAEFDRAIQLNPKDSNAVYYAADCYYRMKEVSKAVILYNIILDKFPDSVAAQYARRALASVSRAVSNGHSPHGLLAPNAHVSRNTGDSPDSMVVPFARESSGHLVVNCMLNGKPQRMIFDTGASVCVATEGQLSRLNIPIPANTPQSYATGVSGTVKTRLMPVEVQLGDLKKVVTMSVMQDLPTLPLLGETFFGAYQYIVDNSTGSIRFVKPGSSSVPSDTINIPFVRSGRELEITVAINNVDVKLLFDTGAQTTVVPASVIGRTNPGQWKLVGYGTTSGVGGTGTCKAYKVNSIEVGSIRQYDFKIVVVDRLPIQYGLLGQDFFGHRKFTIDNEHNMIRFWR